MNKRSKFLIALAIILFALGIIYAALTSGREAELSVDDVSGTDPKLSEQHSEILPNVNIADPVGWEAGEAPKAAKGLQVVRFAEGLEHPRIIFTLPNGDVLVTLTRSPEVEEPSLYDRIAAWFMNKSGAGGASPNKIVLLRDENGDGKAEAHFTLTDQLSSPSGMAWADGKLYVANHNSLVSFPYQLGETKIEAKPHKIMDLPGGGHWMRNILLSKDESSLFIAVGSDSNVAENGLEAEVGRAAIHELDLKKGTTRIFGSGMRNPNGLDFSPWNGELWTTVNERDMLGGDLVPDYLTDVPVGVTYGWPWLYYKDHIDRRAPAPIPSLVSNYTRWPQYALGPHVAPLGLVFTKEGARLGASFAKGAFVARHGSWNRTPASGYDVVYIAFDDLGNPVGKPVPVLTGFLKSEDEAHGRPTWVAFAKDGALLVSDDTGGIIWRVIDPDAAPAAAIVPVKKASMPPQIELKGDPRDAFTDEFAKSVQMPLK